MARDDGCTYCGSHKSHIKLEISPNILKMCKPFITVVRDEFGLGLYLVRKSLYYTSLFLTFTILLYIDPKHVKSLFLAA